MSNSSSSLKWNATPDASPEIVPAWKNELNERLAATRARRVRKPEQQALLPDFEPADAKNESRAAQLAAKVAARYANAPSYSEMLAAEARAAAEAAEAAMTAACEAHAAAQALLAGLENSPEEGLLSGVNPQAEPAGPAIRTVPRTETSNALEAAPVVAPEGAAAQSLGGYSGDPLEEAMISPAQPLPVNLIEFPRELVAARKARPRLAEGPLREDIETMAHDQTQLRIFEVERESISTGVEIEAAPPEWSSIRLDAQPSSLSPAGDSLSGFDLPLKVASLEDRVMAAVFDVGLVLLAFVLFVLVFASCTAHPPLGRSAFGSAGLILLGLFVLYQYLFFRFTEGTPGMRYAKIALCTFNDENPSRKAMRRRIAFFWLSAAPLGLGLIWAWFDADHLSWHDRMTRMYQRSYRS